MASCMSHYIFFLNSLHVSTSDSTIMADFGLCSTAAFVRAEGQCNISIISFVIYLDLI